jgi:hypothetical protein
VVDEAGILDLAAKAALEQKRQQKLADFKTKTTGPPVVVEVAAGNFD